MRLSEAVLIVLAGMNGHAVVKEAFEAANAMIADAARKACIDYDNEQHIRRVVAQHNNRSGN